MSLFNTLPYERRILRRNHETWPRAANPPAWARYRSDLVAALPWFGTAQGAAHTNSVRDPNGHFWEGLLLGGFPDRRSYLDAEVIITSINGSELNTPRSHETQRRHAAMVNNIRVGRMIGVVFTAGTISSGSRKSASYANRPPLLPCSDLPITGPHAQSAWVADWFLPTHMWPTKLTDQDGTVWMVRLEKYHLDRESWWANAGHRPLPTNFQRNFVMRTPMQPCNNCGVQSPRIFNEMFVCLDDRCAHVWRNNGQIISATLPLTYTDAFLQERRSKPLGNISFPSQDPRLIPSFLTWYAQVYQASIGQPVTQANYTALMDSLTRGFCCPYCRMLNQRIRWHEWHCRNSRCDSGNGVPFSIRGAPPLINIQQVITMGAPTGGNQDWTQHPQQPSTTDLPYFTAYEFNLGEGCNVAYLIPKPQTNSQQLSDQFYAQLTQLADNGTVRLERRWLDSPAGQGLTRHFSNNYGERYNFSARVPTTALASAPGLIQQIVNTVNGWTQPWRGPGVGPANELYIGGYWAGQSMNPHTDSEHGLGNIVTTYTVGGGGRFRVSITEAYNSGFAGRSRTERTAIDYDPVIPGCHRQAERTALKAQYTSGQINQAQYRQQFVQLMTQDRQKPHRKYLLDLPATHGTLILMHGPGTQRYLEHEVSVNAPMRFALTFREITPAHLQNIRIADIDAKLAVDAAFDPGQDWMNRNVPGGGGANAPPALQPLQPLQPFGTTQTGGSSRDGRPTKRIRTESPDKDMDIGDDDADGDATGRDTPGTDTAMDTGDDGADGGHAQDPDTAMGGVGDDDGSGGATRSNSFASQTTSIRRSARLRAHKDRGDS